MTAAAPRTARAQLLLDAPPNALHSGIYMAIERGYDDALGVNLRPRLPASPRDAVERLASGGAEFAILDIDDLALARERGRDLVGVMAFVQTPLAAVFALPQIRTPRELAGRRVALGGRPGDVAVLRSVVRGAGGAPAGVRTTQLGAAAVRNLLAGNVTAATGFWSVEGVALQQQRPQIREFRADDYGAPSYPELVLAVTRETLQDHPSLVRATVAALARGYEEVLSDPENGVSTLLEAVQRPRPRPRPARARCRLPLVHGRRTRLRRAQPSAPGDLGALVQALRDHQARAAGGAGVRRALRAEAGAGLSAERGTGGWWACGELRRLRRRNSPHADPVDPAAS